MSSWRNRFWMCLSFLWALELLGQPLGRSFEDAISLEPLFYHEARWAIEAWIKKNVPDVCTDESGEVVCYSQSKTKGDRKYDLTHLSLRDGSRVILYFDVTNELPAEAKNIPELFFFPTYLQTIEEAEIAEVCILKTEAELEPNYVRVSPGLASQFKSALLDASSYNWDGHSACSPNFHARLRLHRGSEILDLDFCFDCSQMCIQSKGRRLPYRDFSTAKFRKLFTTIFPGDTALRK